MRNKLQYFHHGNITCTHNFLEYEGIQVIDPTLNEGFLWQCSLLKKSFLENKPSITKNGNECTSCSSSPSISFNSFFFLILFISSIISRCCVNNKQHSDVYHFQQIPFLPGSSKEKLQHNRFRCHGMKLGKIKSRPQSRKNLGLQINLKSPSLKSSQGSHFQ